MAAGADSPTDRTVDPIGLVDNSGRWYLVADRDGELRTYRVSRIHAVTVLDEAATPADHRPLAEIWTDLRGSLEGRHEYLEVVVRVAAPRQEELRRLLRMQLAPGTGIETVESTDDHLVWRLAVRQPTVIAAVSVMSAPGLMVLEPQWLKDEVRAAALRTLDHYPG
jgi:predicted DNA-binding transcriptional regulator YafY